MLTDWPAPTEEAELLEQVHRRARVITAKRIALRSLPVAVAAIVVSASLLMGIDGRPASLRVAGEGAPAGTEDERTTSETGSDGPSRPDNDGQEPGISIGTGPVGDETVELRPQTLPVPRSETPRPMQGPHLVNDPEGDDTPANDGIDLRYGDLAYQEASDALRVTTGVTDLAAAPVDTDYRFSFRYDDLWYTVSALRRESSSARVLVADHECSSCSLTYDVGRNEVRILVPLAFLNDRIAADSTKSYSAAWPTGHRQSPPLARGSTLDWFRMSAQVLRGGVLNGTDETQPHDTAESATPWTVG